LTIFQKYFNTLRHLKWTQFVFRLRVYFPKYRKTLRKKLSVRDVEWEIIDGVPKADSLSLPDTFRFLNEDASLADIGWQSKEKSDLWIYNQHYFDWLDSRSAREYPNLFEPIALDWIENNKPGEAPGWEPYPTSLRIVNWCKFHWRSRCLSQDVIDNLALQAELLYKSVEWHLMANHLFANGKALIFAGIFFNDPLSDRWLRKGVNIITRQLDEQILADGGHFELSPMYHCIILEDCLDLVNLLGQSDLSETNRLAQKLRARIPSMFNWLSKMSFSDRQISFFNDTTFNISADPDMLIAYAHNLGLSEAQFCPREGDGFYYLEQSGYIRKNKGAFELIFDVGEIGPKYQPGHAHADTLSFELAVKEQRLIINSGISTYGVSEQRLAQRSTASHSTVEIEGENSSEVWSGFRVARRALPFGLTIDQKTDRVSCSHDGYKRLKYSPVHTRQLSFGEDEIQIDDIVSVKSLNAVAYFHIHPDWVLEKTDEGVICSMNDMTVLLTCKAGEGQLVNTQYHVGFNKSRDAHCLRVFLYKGNASINIRSM
jgi:uncharacterized heparinase superfamily protein